MGAGAGLIVPGFTSQEQQYTAEFATGKAAFLTGSTTIWTIRDPDGTLLGIRVGPTATPASGTTYHPFTDRLGNVRAMTTAAGTVQNVTYLYSAAYGFNTATSGSLVQPYKWGSGYTDETTGLIKLGIRYYDPAHGRFTQQDPTGKDKFAYSYGNNCANNVNDPTGAVTNSCAGQAIGVGLAASGIAVGILIFGAGAAAGVAAGTAITAATVGSGSVALGGGILGTLSEGLQASDSC